jgi:hypothetical protein
LGDVVNAGESQAPELNTLTVLCYAFIVGSLTLYSSYGLPAHIGFVFVLANVSRPGACMGSARELQTNKKGANLALRGLRPRVFAKAYSGAAPILVDERPGPFEIITHFGFVSPKSQFSQYK